MAACETGSEPPLKITGDADRNQNSAGSDEYTQPSNLFRLMAPRPASRRRRSLVDVAIAVYGSTKRTIFRPAHGKSSPRQMR